VLARWRLDEGPHSPPPARIRDTALRLPTGVLLEQRVSLPLAAARDPRQVLHYEMDRLTPFKPDDVFWSCSIERADRTTRQLTVLLSLVPKASLQPLLGALASSGLRASVLEASRPDGSLLHIPFATAPTIRKRLQARAEVVLGLTCAALAATAIFVPFTLQTITLERVESRIAELQPLVAQAEAARTRLTAEAGTASSISAERTRIGDALQALAAITDLLPDDTYLTDLTLRARRLTVGGRSDAAVKLIPTLAADRTIGNPAFLTPVTRAASGRPDVFSIAAELIP
jgi:general secretion pathway protein L